MRAKAQLVSRVAELLAERGMTEAEAATLLGISQPKLSKVLRGHFRSEGTSAGMLAYTRSDPSLAPERKSLFGRLMARMREGPSRERPNRDLYPSGPEGTRIYARDYDAWEKANGPKSWKARFLVAIGRRTGDEEYAVGATP